MLIDDYLPEFDFKEKHDISITANTAKVYLAINETDFSESPIVRWLLWLRGMSGKGVSIRNVTEFKFATLGEVANKELLIGLAGRFWTPLGDLQPVNAVNFRAFDKAGYAKAVWNFSLEHSNGQTRLTTETRIRCLDEKSRRRFGFYWTFIQPFSGLIRMEMLKLIKQKAEANAI